MGRPRVVIYGRVAVDGRITVASDGLLLFGDGRWPCARGSEDAQARLVRLYEPQAMLEGSNSFARDGDVPDPPPPAVGDLVSLFDESVPSDVARRPGFRRWFVVVGGRGRVR